MQKEMLDDNEKVRIKKTWTMSDMTPQKMEALTGNQVEIQKLMTWLTDFKNKRPNTQKAALINGPIGCGKTLIARLALKSADYDIVECDAADIRSSKTLKEVIYKVTASGNVASVLHADAKANSLALLVDDIESMNVTDKGGISELIHTINPLRGKRSVKKSEKEDVANHWSIPIICICNDCNDKRSVDLSKDCRQIILPGFTPEEARDFVENKCQEYKINIATNVIDSIIRICAKDVRRMLLLLLEIMNNVEKTTKPSEIINQHIIMEQSSDLYKATSCVMFHKLRQAEALEMYEKDRTLLPLMVHENYPMMITKKNLSPKINDGAANSQSLHLASCLMKCLSRADNIDRSVYNLQSWNLTPFVGIFGIWLPNMLLMSTVSHSVNHNETIKFTANLSKTSLQHANNKNIEALLNDPRRPGFHYEDLMTLVTIFEMIPLDCLTRKSSLLSEYGLTLDCIRKIKRTYRHDK